MAVSEIKKNNAVDLPTKFVGLSTDTKPITLANGNPIPSGSTFWAYDTKTAYIYADGDWRVV